MRKLSDYPEAAAAYKAVFDNFPPVDWQKGERGPLKWAADHGAVPQLVQAMREAIKSGKPLDFNNFAQTIGRFLN